MRQIADTLIEWIAFGTLAYVTHRAGLFLVQAMLCLEALS